MKNTSTVYNSIIIWENDRQMFVRFNKTEFYPFLSKDLMNKSIGYLKKFASMQ